MSDNEQHKHRERQPWHYNVFEGQPEWSKALARLNVLRRQEENLATNHSRKGRRIEA